jgi:8-oxo-dGTP diphosphatase
MISCSMTDVPDPGGERKRQAPATGLFNGETFNMPYSYQYPHMAVTVDAVLVAEGARGPTVLLIKRANDPFKDSWALPGGYVDMNEEALAAAERELAEETNIHGIKLSFLNYFDAIHRDPRERTLSLAFFGCVDEEMVNAAAADDASDVGWFSSAALPPLAFDHANIIDCAIKAYKSKASRRAD